MSLWTAGLHATHNGTTCTPLTKRGWSYVGWIRLYFGSCVYTPTEIGPYFLSIDLLAAFAIGLLCTLIWMIYLIPQIVKTFTVRNVDGVSMFLLLFWLFGDSLNFFGALFAGTQEITQVITAGWYICMDVFSVSQWLFFKLCFERLCKKCSKRGASEEQTPLLASEGEESESPVEIIPSDSPNVLPLTINTDSKSVNAQAAFSFLFVGVLGIPFLARHSFGSSPNSGQLVGGIGFHSNSRAESIAFEVIGYTLGTIYAVLTTSSRLCQICHNCRRQSTEGLSIVLFGATLLGNLTYNLSLILFAIESGNFWKFILVKLPWMAGVFGGFFTDCFIVGQFLYYTYIFKSKREVEAEMIKEK